MRECFDQWGIRELFVVGEIFYVLILVLIFVRFHCTVLLKTVKFYVNYTPTNLKLKIKKKK